MFQEQLIYSEPLAFKAEIHLLRIGREIREKKPKEIFVDDEPALHNKSEEIFSIFGRAYYAQGLAVV